MRGAAPAVRATADAAAVLAPRGGKALGRRRALAQVMSALDATIGTQLGTVMTRDGSL